MVSGVTRQCLAAFAGALAMMMAGTSYGWPSTVLKRLQDPADEYHLSLAQSSLMVSIISFGEISSPIPSGYLANKIGRKYMLLVTAPLYIISWILIVTVKHAYALYVMRMLQGIGSGIVCTVVPLYLSEVAAPQVRGFIGALSMVMWSLGILFEFCVGPYVTFDDLAYVNNLLPILFIASFVCMPESPYYLLMNHEDTKAEQTLKWLRGKDDVEAERNEIANSYKNENDGQNKSSCSQLITNKVTFRFLIIVLILAVIKFMSGYSAIVSFASITFVNDKRSPISADQFAIFAAGINVVCSTLTGFVVDRLGRRPLFLISTTGCAVALGTTAVLYFLIDVTRLSSESFVWLTFSSISLYFISFSFGLGPLLPLVQAEYFPCSVRSLASGITVITASVTVFFSMTMYQIIADTVGIYVNFIVSTAVCVLGIIFIAVFVPETKGKSFAEIQQEAERKVNKVGRDVSHL